MRRTQSNRVFWRAINSFLHPVSIAAVALLIINDHWLRWQHPSWLTGKLGDFTWLIFAPFVAAACFAWVIPQRLKRHEKLVGWLSFVVIGVWFALAKTAFPIHEITVKMWEAVIGWQGSQRMDATDLLALTGLALGWWVFWRTDNQRLTFRPAATILFALGIVGTLASDDPMYYYTDSGITQLCATGSEILTSTETEPQLEIKPIPANPNNNVFARRYNIFRSDDGGMTWQKSVEESAIPEGAACVDSNTTIARDPRNLSIQYRWQPGERIERSRDGGQTWTLEYELIEMQQDARRYFNHYSSIDSYGSLVRKFIVGPVSGMVDHKTGNLILAMSWDGVLVRTPDSKWHWRDVGSQYKLADLNSFSRLPSMLFFELWLAGALGFLVITSSTVYMRQYVLHWEQFRYALLIIGWGGWLILILMLNHSKTPGEGYMEIALISFALLIFLAIPLSIGAVWDIARNFRGVGRYILFVAVGVALLFIAPFIPWTQGTIPRYTTALNFSFVLAGAGLFAGFIYLSERLPILDKPKRKGKVIEVEHPLPIDADTPSPSSEN